jgi:hypothetical protein
VISVKKHSSPINKEISQKISQNLSNVFTKCSKAEFDKRQRLKTEMEYNAKESIPTLFFEQQKNTFKNKLFEVACSFTPMGILLILRIFLDFSTNWEDLP